MGGSGQPPNKNLGGIAIQKDRWGVIEGGEEKIHHLDPFGKVEGRN